MNGGVTIRHDGFAGYDLLNPDGTACGWVSGTLHFPAATHPTPPMRTPPPSLTIEQPPPSPASPGPPDLRGPFECRDAGGDEYHIVGGNGQAAVRVVGRKNADLLARLLNLAHRHGKV